jgi:hypothetical protein
MAEPEQIVEALDALLNPRRDFEGRHVLVTAGPTVERIDPVRYITNRSSGKMGYAIAEVARDRGAEVVLVSGPVNLAAPEGVEVVKIESSAELCAAVLARGDWADVVIQAAAPADYTPVNVSETKIKKTGVGMMLELKNTTDIAKTLGERKHPGQVLVAFAAETDRVLENAKGKLEKKNADLIVANDVTQEGAGFNVDTNIAAIITRDGIDRQPLQAKRQLAEAILDRADTVPDNFMTEYIDERDDEFQTAVRMTRQNHVKGLIFVGSLIDDRVRAIKGMDVPMVFTTVNAETAALPRASSVAVDDRAMGRLVAEELLSLGHTRTAVFGSNPVAGDSLAMRFSGFCEAYTERGLTYDKSLYRETRFSYDAGYEIAFGQGVWTVEERETCAPVGSLRITESLWNIGIAGMSFEVMFSRGSGALTSYRWGDREMLKAPVMPTRT